MKKRIIIKNVGKAEVVKNGVLFTDRNGISKFHECNTYSIDQITRFVVRRYFQNDQGILHKAFSNATY